MNLKEFLAKWNGCKRCPLHHKRRNMVFYRGNIPAEVVLMGEAPGAEEDNQGLPFVGRSGIILDQILDQVGFKLKTAALVQDLTMRALSQSYGGTLEQTLDTSSHRKDCPFSFCIINTVACRPPMNRNPDPEELEACNPRIRDFLSMFPPPYTLVGVGKTAQETIEETLSDIMDGDMIQYIKIYHPAYLLRQGRAKLIPYILESSSLISRTILKGREHASS